MFLSYFILGSSQDVLFSGFFSISQFGVTLRFSITNHAQYFNKKTIQGMVRTVVVGAVAPVNF